MAIQDITKTAAALALTVEELIRRAKNMSVKQASVQASLPEVVNVLVSNRRIRPNEKQAALQKLSSHQGCLDLICRLARHQPSQAVQSIGEPTSYGSTKSAGFRPKDVIPPLRENPAALDMRRRLGLL